MTRDEILKTVLDAMQLAEEIHGPDKWDYLALMSDIARAANTRANTYRASNAATMIGPRYVDVFTHAALKIGRAYRDVYGTIFIELAALPVNGRLAIESEP